MRDGDENSKVETGPWNPSWVAAFPAGVVASQDEDGRVVLDGGSAQFRVSHSDPLLGKILASLEPPGTSIRNLVRTAQESGIAYGVARLLHHLQGFLEEGFLSLSVFDGDERLATLVAVSSGFRLSARTEDGRRRVLSRFACLRRGYEGLIAESPRSLAQVALHSPKAVQSVLAFAAALNDDSTAAVPPDLSTSAASALADLLGAAELLTTLDQDGNLAEDEDKDLLCWEFHDLLFHTRSRRGRFAAPFGAMCAVADRVPPPPTLKAPRAEIVPLARPDLEAVALRDPSLTTVLERRQSVREQGDVPLSVGQLGEFLFRVARIRDRRAIEVATENGPVELEVISRPYPSGGALHELEFYPVVQSCGGLEAGLYRYVAESHGLERVCPLTEETQRLFDDASFSAGVDPDRIQVLIVLSARFPRIAWKYSAFAYSLVMKHVGVAFQTMYLVATAMNLAPCGLGVGDADRFSRLVSDSPFAETSVGEFLLGSRV